jgi:UPF0042 nucleotide-binding protein
MEARTERGAVVSPPEQAVQMVIITGYSGAGKSTVLRSLEDLGYFCVDNLPIDLLPHFFQLLHRFTTNSQRVALGIDIRGGTDIEHLVEKIIQARQQGLSISVFFLTTSLQVLLKRYQETRRNHPLGNSAPLQELITQEKKLLEPLNRIADIVVETDQCTPHQLRAIVRSYFGQTKEPVLVVHALSFGFKYGVPAQCNFVYDIRSLPNPYFIEQYKHLDGTDPGLRTYLFSLPAVQEYWHKLIDFIDFSLNKSYQEGRFFVTLAIGCTGGRHRSVAFVHELAKRTLPSILFVTKHRDIGREPGIVKREGSHDQVRL